MGGVVSRGNGRRWRIWYIDRHGKRRWGTGHADKRASQKLADELEQEERRIREGLVDPKARERRAAASADVAVLLGLWREYMVAKGDGAKHANHQATAARRVLESAGVVSIAAIDSDAINGAIGRMTVIIKKKVQPASARTRNHALGSVKAFCRWLEQTDRLSEFPRGLKAIKPRSIEADRRRERRAPALPGSRRSMDRPGAKALPERPARAARGAWSVNRCGVLRRRTNRETALFVEGRPRRNRRALHRRRDLYDGLGGARKARGARRHHARFRAVRARRARGRSTLDRYGFGKSELQLSERRSDARCSPARHRTSDGDPLRA